MEGHGVLAVLSWAGAFDSISSASLAARRPPSAPVAHSSRAFRARAIGIGLTRLAVLFSLLTGPVYFIHAVVSQSNSLFDWFHRHSVIVLGVTFFALMVLRLRSPRTAPPVERRWAISACEFVLLVFVMLQTCTIQRDLHPDNYPFVDDLNEPFRKPVEQRLAAMPGQHLVLVRY